MRAALDGAPAPNPPRKADAVRLAAGLALVAVCAAFPAFGQYFPPPLIIVPPPAQDYATPKPAPRPAPDNKAKPSANPPPDAPKGHYQGRTFIPD